VRCGSVACFFSARRALKRRPAEGDDVSCGFTKLKFVFGKARGGQNSAEVAAKVPRVGGFSDVRH
jgi:hypothetical protein